MTLLNTIIFAVVFLLLPAKIEAANYYVATNGSDTNPGTESQPWITIQKAANIMQGGDTVYIRGGTYNQRVILEYKTNTSGPYLTFSAYPGETVILNGQDIPIQYGGGLFHIWNTDYVRVTGLRLQNSNGAGIYAAYSDRIQIESNQTYDTVKSGISTWGVTNALIAHNDIALACNSHPNFINPLYSASEENISIDNSTYVEVKNNHVHKASNIPDGYSGGEGINVKNGSAFVKIHHNTVHLDERPDGKPSNRLAYGVDAWNSLNSTRDVEFYGNIAYNSSYGFIVSSEQGSPVENIKLYNNLAYNNRNAGFSIVWWSGTVDAVKRDIQFTHNTSYHNGIGFSIQSPKNENIIVRNNIFSQNSSPIALVAEAVTQTTIDHNLYYPSVSAYDTHPLVGDPRFVNASQADFHLQSTSPAIDAGINAEISVDFDHILRPQGSGYDIGAYEYVSAPTPAPLSGDYDQDGDVDFLDLTLLLTHFSQPYTIFSLNQLIQNL